MSNYVSNSLRDNHSLDVQGATHAALCYTPPPPPVTPPPPIVTAPAAFNAHAEKPEKLSDTDFKTWKQKMFFYLMTLHLARFLKEVTVKELWESLEKKYKTEDAGTKKFVVGKFLEFKMVDTKTVISQVQEFQIILHDIMTEGMMISESFQVAALIEKLPPLWKEFKNYLKHKRKKMGFEDLIVRLRIKEDNRKAEIKAGKMPMEAKANLVEPNAMNKRKKFGKDMMQGKNKKWKGTFWNCGKMNHKTNDCRLPKKDNHYRENVVQHKSVPIDLSEIYLSAVVFEANMVDHPREWYIDTGATRHVCADKELFSKYTPISGRELYMGKNATSKIIGLGKVVIKMTSGKELTLIDVLHVPDIRKNLVSGSRLVKAGFRIVFEAGKVIEPKTVDCIFIGYANNSSAYRFLVHKSVIPDIHENTIIESRNAAFFENVFPYKEGKENSSFKRVHESTNEETHESDEPRRSKRAKIAKTFGPDFLSYAIENDPRTLSEALSSPDAPFWKEAIKSEIDSIMQNHTWELVDLPPGSKPLGCKWILKRKYKADGTVKKYKARLVAKRFRQKEGLDFFDTYSPVTRIMSIRVLIAIATLNNLEIHQMNVKTAFLNGELEEEIYMTQPEGFIAPGQERKVCRLIKALYWLKQAPKQWHTQ
ncbi:uncharacterized protein [Henckelia pumila]|uniref:uncharacterized protein n=1 Tax=Henckelia pumila TaxID=405737 RepID=UPI003C6DB96D